MKKLYVIVWYDDEEELPFKIDSATLKEFYLGFKYVNNPKTGEGMKRDSWSGGSFPDEYTFTKENVNSWQKNCIGMSVRDLVDLTPQLLKEELEQRKRDALRSKKAYESMKDRLST